MSSMTHRLSLADSDSSNSTAVSQSLLSPESASQYQRNTLPAATRSSTASIEPLPSIHEVLSNDNPLPYRAPDSAPPSQTGDTTAPPSYLIGKPGTEGPSGPLNPSFNPPIPLSQPRSQEDSIHTADSHMAPIESSSARGSPTRSAKTGITSVSGMQSSTGYYYSTPSFASHVNNQGLPVIGDLKSHPPGNDSMYPPAHLGGHSYNRPQWNTGVMKAERNKATEQGEVETAGSFAGADAKKRRGVRPPKNVISISNPQHRMG